VHRRVVVALSRLANLSEYRSIAAGLFAGESFHLDNNSFEDTAFINGFLDACTYKLICAWQLSLSIPFW